MNTDNISVFDCGVADFNYVIELEKDKTISVNLINSNVNIFVKEGQIEILEYPSKKLETIKIDVNDFRASFFKGMVGKEIIVNSQMEGVIKGVDYEDRESAGFLQRMPYLNLLYKGKICSIPFSEIKEFTFDEFNQNTLKIKSKSDKAIVNLSLLNKIPEWKPQYQLNILKKKCFLNVSAFIENDTNQDWENCNLKFYSGDPANSELIFETKNATVRKGSRTFIVGNNFEFSNIQKCVYFKPDEDKEIKSPAILIKNNLKFRMRKGNCRVYEGEKYKGDVTIPELETEESKVVLFDCPNYDIKIDYLVSPTEETVKSIDLEKGICRTVTEKRVMTSYKMINKSSENKKVVFEYNKIFENSLIEYPCEKISENRFSVDVIANSELNLPIVESQEVKNEFVPDYEWIENNIVPKVPKKYFHNWQRFVEARLSKEISEKKLIELESNIAKIIDSSEEARSNLKVLEKNDENYKHWSCMLTSLDKKKKTLEEIDLANLRSEVMGSKERFDSAFNLLLCKWKNNGE